MAVTGNPYGFYPDRTKYPLANLDGQLVPAPHQHVLADITDYDDSGFDPEDTSQWEQGYIAPDGTEELDPGDDWYPYSIVLKETAAIPVEGGKTYVFDLNTGYQGRILFYDGNGDLVQLPEMASPPQIYPFTWTAPEDGTVRFVIQKIGVNPDVAGQTEEITPTDPFGIEFKPSSLSRLEEIITKETTEEEGWFVADVVVSTGASATQTKKFGLHMYRRGHLCSAQIVGWGAYIPALSGSNYEIYRYVVVPAANWQRVKSWTYTSAENPITNIEYDPEHPTVEGLPQQFKPSIALGDMYANTILPGTNKIREWVNLQNGGGDIDGTALKKGDMIVWRWSDSREECPSTYFISSFTFCCLG